MAYTFTQQLIRDYLSARPDVVATLKAESLGKENHPAAVKAFKELCEEHPDRNFNWPERIAIAARIM